MASDLITQFNRAWAPRLAALQAQGVDPQRVAPIYQQDLRRVLTKGSSPYTGLEAETGIQSALTGQEIVTPPQKKRGVLGAVENFGGNAVEDLANIGKGVLSQFVKQPAEAVVDVAKGDPGAAWATLKQGWTPQTAGATALALLGGVLGATGIGAAATPELEAAAAGLEGTAAAADTAAEAAGAEMAGEGSEAAQGAKAAEEQTLRARLRENFAKENPARAALKVPEAGLLAEQAGESIHKEGLNAFYQHPLGTLLMLTPAAGELGKGAAFAMDAASGGALSAAVAEKAPLIEQAKREGQFNALKAGQEVRLHDGTIVTPDDYKIVQMKGVSGGGPVLAGGGYAPHPGIGAAGPEPVAPEPPEPGYKPPQSGYKPPTGPARPGLGPRELKYQQDVAEYEKARAARAAGEATRARMRNVTDAGPAGRPEYGGNRASPTHADVAKAARDAAAERKPGTPTSEGGRIVEDLTKRERAYEALSQGRPLKGAYRSIVPDPVQDAIALRVNNFMLATGVSQFQRFLTRGHAAETARLTAEAGRIEQDANALLRETSPADIQRLSQAIRTRMQAGRWLENTLARFTPEQIALAHRIVEFNDKIRRISGKDTPDAIGILLKGETPESKAMFEQERMTRIEAKVADKARAGQLKDPIVTHTLDDIYQKGAWKNYFSPKEWAALNNDIQRTVMQQIINGQSATFRPNPEFTGRFTEDAGADPHTALEDKSPKELQGRIFDGKAIHTPVTLGLDSSGWEYVRRAGARMTAQRFLMPTALTREQVEREVEPHLYALPQEATRYGDTVGEQQDRLINERFKSVDPARFGMDGPTMYVDRDVYRTFEQLTKGFDEPDRAIKKAFTGTSRILRKSLFFTPRHIAHATLGSAFAMLARGDFDTIRAFPRAWAALKAGELPEGVSDHLDVTSADQLHQYSQGKSFGRMLAKIPGGIQRMEEFVQNFERTSTYFGEEARHLRLGSSPELAREAALEAVHKTFVDIGGMTPFEQTAIRTYFPFYTFSKYVVQFVLSFPVDHPVRAAIMANLGEQETAQWKSGLPRSWMGLAMIGRPDLAGNVLVSNIRSIDPFRDASNLFSLTGFFQGLSPVLRLPLQAAGFNTLSGTPEMYPQLSLDPETGQVAPARPGLSYAKVAEALAPPVQSLDTFFSLSQDARNMKASNPDGFRMQLFDQLGIPFVPYRVNLTRERFLTSNSRFQIAQQEVANATKGGGTAALRARGTSLVPFQGKLVPAAALADYIDMWQRYAAAQGTVARSVMPSTRR